MKAEDIQKTLLELNPNIFDGAIAPEDYKVRLVGEFEVIEKNGQRVKSRNWFLKPKRTMEGMEAGYYLTVELLPLGQVQKITSTDDNGNEVTMLSFRGLTKAKTINVFQTSQPILFNYLAQVVGKPNPRNEKEWTSLSKEEMDAKPDIGSFLINGKGNPTVGINRTIDGKWITVNCPAYNPQTIDADGIASPLKANHIDRTTGKVSQRPAISTSFSFFAFSEEVDNVLARAAKEYTRSVAGYEIGEIITTIKKPGLVTTSSKVNNPDPDENLVGLELKLETDDIPVE